MGMVRCIKIRKNRLEVFKNRVLRGILAPRKEKLTGHWRKLNNEEIHNLRTPRKNIIK
jgi:hypothetical protein